MTDFKMLRKIIDESGMTMKAIAEKAGMQRPTLHNRFAGIGEFTGSEIMGLTAALHLTNKQRDAIFFAKIVDKKGT